MNQSWAAAYSNARRHPRAEGGGLGADAPPVADLQFNRRSRQDLDNEYHNDTPIDGAVVSRFERDGEAPDEAERRNFNAWASAIKAMRANRDAPIGLAAGGSAPGDEIPLDEVRSTYPGLAPHLGNAVAQWGPPTGHGSMETYLPHTEDSSPHPDKLVFEVYDRNLKGDALRDSLAADAFHWTGAQHEGKPVDPAWRGMREQYAKSLTADQLNTDSLAHHRAQREDGETRPFNDWFDQSRLDAYIRAGLFPAINPEWEKPGTFTPDQEKLHAKMRNHITRGTLAPEDVPHKGFGGGLINLPSEMPSPSYGTRQASRELFHPGGLIKSGVAGRTDRIPMSVAANSYVLPADVVSGLGQGNTLSGARVLDHALKSGPWGTALPRGGGRGHPPPAPAPWHPPHQTMPGGFAMGGVPHGIDAVKIIAAGGEYVVSPDVVEKHPMLGRGNMKRGHEVLDHFVKHVRAQTTKTLKKLPGPKKD